MLLIFICFASFFKINTVYSSLPLLGKIVVVDSGHGGVDPGSVYEDIYEKDINLEISKKIEEELIKLGATVIMTRDGDYDLSSPGATWRKTSDFNNRIDLINNSGAHIYLSIHMNYLNNANYGDTGIFYYDDKELAEIVQDYINENLDMSRVVKEIPINTYMYSKLNIPGILVECGFLSNYTDRTNFQNEIYQAEFAKLIAESLINYF